MLTELYLSDSTGPIYPGPKSRENERTKESLVSPCTWPLLPRLHIYIYIYISPSSYRCNRPLMCRWKRTHIAEPSSVTAFAVTHISHYWNLSSVAGFGLHQLRPWIDERLPPPSLSSPSITTKGEDVRLRDARQRSLFIEYLYTIQLSFKGRRGERKGGRTLEGSRVTQTGIGCQSQTMGDRIDTCRFRESIEEGVGEKWRWRSFPLFRFFSSVFTPTLFDCIQKLDSRDYW